MVYAFVILCCVVLCCSDDLRLGIPLANLKGMEFDSFMSNDKNKAKLQGKLERSCIPYATHTQTHQSIHTDIHIYGCCGGCVCSPLMGPSGKGILFCSYSYFVRHNTKSPAENLSARLKKGDHDILNDPKYPPLPTPTPTLTPPSSILSVWCVVWCGVCRLCRFAAIVEWLGGKDAQGTIVFDESHKVATRRPIST